MGTMVSTHIRQAVLSGCIIGDFGEVANTILSLIQSSVKVHSVVTVESLIVSLLILYSR